MGKISCLLTVMVIALAKNVYSACPPPSSVVPCFCDSDGGVVSIVCEHPEIDGIYKALDAMSKKSLTVDLIQIASTGALSLRKDLFGYMKVTAVELSFPNLKTINYNAFTNQEYSLQSLSLKKSKLSQLPMYAMTTLTTLDSIEVSGSKEIEVIESNAFEPMPRANSIKTVLFTSNKIKVIERDAFFELRGLRSINLKDNVITRIDARSLPPSFSLLQELILWDNSLETIPSTILRGMSKAATLDLYGNNLTVISSADIDEIIEKQLKVMLGSNPLDCTCSFKAIATANNQKMLTIDSGTCSSPAELKDKDLTSLSSNDFLDCP